MSLSLVFFGKVADRLGIRHAEYDIAVAGLSLYALRDKVFADAFETGVLCVDDRRLSDGNEIAFFSPFSGG